MKKKHLLAGILFGAMTLDGQMQAYFWTRIVNKLPYPVEVYGMGHRTYTDETNVKVIPKGKAHSFWISGPAMKSQPMFVRPKVLLKLEPGVVTPRQYYDTFHTELSFPIHKPKAAQIKRRYLLSEAPGEGVKMKESLTAKERWSFGLSPEPWHELTRERTFIGGREQQTK